MTTKADWQFRAFHLRDHASYLERKAEEMLSEARRFSGLAEQAEMLVRIGDHEGWQPISTYKRGDVVQVWAAHPDGSPFLPLTAFSDYSDRWSRPATADPLPFQPTHWRRLPAAPRVMAKDNT